MMRRALPLDRWTISVLDPEPEVPPHIADLALDVTAPVSVHTALLVAGAVPDPRFERHEDDLHWIGRATWQMTTELAPNSDDLADPERRFSLDFGGLDTIATVTLGATEVLRSQSMHVAHRVDVTELVRADERTLRIRFDPVVAWAEAQRERLGDRPFVEWDEGALPFHFARKMACNFGWDWGPTVVTAGLWRPAALVAWSRARITHVRPLVREVAAEEVAAEEVAAEEVAANAVAADEGAAEELAANELAANELAAGDGGASAADAGASGSPPTPDRLAIDVFVDLETTAGPQPGGESVQADANASAAAPHTPAAVPKFPSLDSPHEPPLQLEISLTDPDGTVVARAVHPADGSPAVLEVDSPRRWWPHDYGDQPLYQLEVELVADTGALDRAQRRVGLRTVRLDITGEGDDGARFAIEINGRPIFCKGANWIPDDCFVDVLHGDPDRIRRRLELAVAAHHDMLRVWGGGIYELPEFYDACDELGILVWQDFLFACAMYPEEPPYDALVEAEAREAVAARAHHASLVLWNGCNENFWAHKDWGWPPWHVQLAGKTWGEGFYLDLLPRVCAELDPSRPYWPGSPYSAFEIDAQHDDYGTRHVWDAWNETRPEVYRDYRPRFVAEFGFQGPATRSTWREALGDPLPDPASELVHRHQKAIEGRKKLAERLSERYSPVDPAEPDAIEHWLHRTQANQARAVEMGITAWRAQWPRCTGALYWQLNDCWPAISWASLDWRCRRKPLWYALRRAFAPRLVSIERALDGDGLDLVAINDTDAPWSPRIRCRRLQFPNGEVLAEVPDSGAVSVARRSVVRVPLPASIARPGSPAAELVCADVVAPASAPGTGTASAPHAPEAPMRATWWWAAPVEMAVQASHGGYRATLERRGPHESVLEVVAERILRDLVVAADRQLDDVEVDRNVLTLLPGERVFIALEGPVVPTSLDEIWVGV